VRTARVLALGIVLFASVVVPAAAGVVINELMADPASDWSPSDGDEVYDSLDDEWIELVNTGNTAVDMTGWRLRDAVSDSSWKYGFSGPLAAGNIIVIYGNEAYAWEDANGCPRNGLSLNNGGDTIELVRPDGTVAERVEYTGGEVRDDCSYGRLPDGGVEWVMFDGLNPTSPPATGLVPTPGEPNVGSPVEERTWGRIKALYTE
jgi:hypothetical protein